MKEVFDGNLYLFFTYNKLNKKDIQTEKKNDFSEKYLTLLNKQFDLEITNNIGKEIQRTYLDSLDFYYLDDNESLDINKTEKAHIFISSDKITGLTIVTIVFFKTKIEISQILDRLSQNNIKICIDNKDISLEEYLKSEYDLEYLGSSKACISTNKEIDDKLYPNYFANETFDSQTMNASLKQDKYFKNTNDNIAQYNSSDLYAAKNTVIRIDKRENYPNKLKSDIIFLFIMEVLMFKECAINRANNKMLKQLTKKEKIDINELDVLYDEFSKTVAFWDISIFKYVSAQNLANELEIKFETKEKYNQYKQYQDFINNKINVKQTIELQRENMILFSIALIVFIFEVYGFLKDFSTKSYSLSISFFVLITIIFLKNWKRKT
ncbi:MAG: hypothetical protein CL623_07555 [Arcobacter sp.]|nr:hypothetical protein [Arcobacter sp.]|tara:strand:+ start:9122 stop:10261 length:1140 start_codon:yes stop_codon:yes gene_type:complete